VPRTEQEEGKKQQQEEDKISLKAKANDHVIEREKEKVRSGKVVSYCAVVV